MYIKAQQINLSHLLLNLVSKNLERQQIQLFVQKRILYYLQHHKKQIAIRNLKFLTIDMYQMKKVLKDKVVWDQDKVH